MGLFSARCPIGPREQAWIDKILGWCVANFGELPLLSRVVVPTPDFLPGTYAGTEPDVLDLFHRVRGLLGIDPDRVALELDRDEMDEDLAAMGAGSAGRVTAAGHYRRRAGRGQIFIDLGQAGDPLTVAAVAAHELCHELLLGRGGIPGAAGEDHEPLTDLLSVYTGFGVFTANAAFHFEADAHGWRTKRLGYLNVPMFGYALACYAWLRGEAQVEPHWAGFLETNQRGYMKQGIRFLAQNGPSPALARFAPTSRG